MSTCRMTLSRKQMAWKTKPAGDWVEGSSPIKAWMNHSALHQTALFQGQCFSDLENVGKIQQGYPSELFKRKKRRADRGKPQWLGRSLWWKKNLAWTHALTRFITGHKSNTDNDSSNRKQTKETPCQLMSACFVFGTVLSASHDISFNLYSNMMM